MGTIEDKLRYLAKTKKDIMNALKSKGVEIDESTPFSEYDVMVKNIQGGGDVLLCKNMEELEEKGELSLGSLVMVYDEETDTFGGIYEVTGTGLQVLPTQLTADVANVAPGVKAFGPNGIVEGTFTSDANATASDIIAPKTAYVNGEKITGTMEATYSTSIPTQILDVVDYTTNLNDYISKYHIGVYNDTSRCYVYYTKSGTTTRIASAGVSGATLYSGTSRLSNTPVEIDGGNYLRVYASCTLRECNRSSIFLSRYR